MKKQNLYTTDHIVNKKMPNLISTELFTGEETNLSELVAKEKFTILNIWASWCAPCRSEHKHLITLSSNNNSKIVGLNYKDKIENAKSFISELGNPYAAIGSDQSGKTAIEWGVYGIPETFLLDKENKILLRIAGPITESIYENQLKEYLEE